ncbi:hypothetical protein [Rhodohalobacter sp. SW132]|uniref:hypothetical protein n=1 Tax=Rhodohalobacter sp. SW132 TaxID=2293433 RepID=UPI0011C01C86|nr:hypothetical protein [Rhodohalobacter sp. SW132]
MELTPHQKLCWYFINDRCDNIGVWTPNPKLIAFNLDIEGNPQQFLDDFLQAINEADELIHVMPSGEWLITDFVKFQYCQKKPLHPNNPAHKSYLQLIKEQNLLSWFSVNYPETLPESYLNEEKKTSIRPLKEPFETYKDKDIDRDTDRDIDTDKAQELEPFKQFAP